jgi:hypothetical protein
MTKNGTILFTGQPSRSPAMDLQLDSCDCAGAFVADFHQSKGRRSIMSTITITFEDLCVFFTSKLPQHLAVGMIETSQNTSKKDRHQPSVTIKKTNGRVIKKYNGFKEVSGDISLDTGAPAQGLSIQATDDGTRHPFSYLIDIERTLYRGVPLHVDASKCAARFNFLDGRLYTKGRLFMTLFASSSTSSKVIPHVHSAVAAVKCGLDVTIPDGVQATLNFSNGTQSFTFEQGKDYQVYITNKAQSINNNHFRFYYDVLQQPPPFKLVPMYFIPVTNGRPGRRTSDPLCMIGGYGKTDYR